MASLSALSVQVHPATAKAYDIPETYVVELNLSAIEDQLQPAQPFTEITKFQLSAVMWPFAQGRNHSPRGPGCNQAAGVKRLTDIKLFDIFSGDKLVSASIHGLQPDFPKSRSQPD